MKFRTLRADEIDARVSTVTEKGCSLLLYKDARTDQNILDETVGAMNWEREHILLGDRLYCRVSIWDAEKNMWVSKEDVGVETYTEKEKGQASDSFKRACFNWGIGRELYTAPFIWINTGDVKLVEKNGKWTTYDRFRVKEIDYTDGVISRLEITNEKLGGRVVFKMGESLDSNYPTRAAMIKKIIEKYPDGSDEQKRLEEFFGCEIIKATEEQIKSVYNKVTR